MMKKIKIKYIGFWSDFVPEEFKMTQILRKHFDVEICDDPDYVICSCIGEFYEFLKYPQVRIEFIAENYIPDFNVIDYSISPYPIKLLDRSFHLPQGMGSAKINKYLEQRTRGTVSFDRSILDEKTVFANFCASHESEYNMRGEFFRKLCEYKKVDSIGTYLNNTDVYVKNTDNSKYEYQKKCKFTLCFESTAHGGFNTEKIVDAFRADTLPVYYGDPNIGDIFNKSSFIDISDYDSFDEAIEKIMELDNDDEKYLEMLNQPILVDPDYPDRLEKEFEEFIVNIFEQPIEKAYRRCRIYYPHYFESFLKNCSRIYYSKPVKAAVALKKLLNKPDAQHDRLGE